MIAKKARKGLRELDVNSMIEVLTPDVRQKNLPSKVVFQPNKLTKSASLNSENASNVAQNEDSDTQMMRRNKSCTDVSQQADYKERIIAEEKIARMMAANNQHDHEGVLVCKLIATEEGKNKDMEYPKDLPYYFYAMFDAYVK